MTPTRTRCTPASWRWPWPPCPPGRPAADADPFVALAHLIDPPAAATPDAPLILADNLITGPTSREAATRPVDQPDNGFQRTLAEFVGHFAPYQPVYFIAGPDGPLVRFQFSFKYRLFNPDAPVGKIPVLGKLNFAYTQLSLWDLTAPSAPFYDTNYQPEAFYNDDDVQWLHLPGVQQLR